MKRLFLILACCLALSVELIAGLIVISHVADSMGLIEVSTTIDGYGLKD